MCVVCVGRVCRVWVVCVVLLSAMLTVYAVQNLPPGLRNRFTEFYVDELSNVEDLRTVVHSYIKGCVAQPPVDDIVNLYLAARQQSQIDLTDGANQRPHYSLRTLCRALEYALLIQPDYGFKRALYEGFSMSFLTQLNTASVPTMLTLIRKYLVMGYAVMRHSRWSASFRPSATYERHTQ